MANVELKKELLIAQEKKIEVIERIKNGEKKYEDLWNESKARYESLRFVQKLLKAENEVRNLELQNEKLENEGKALVEKIKVEKEACLIVDRKRIIELAEFMVKEMPKIINIIYEKSAAVKYLIKELDSLVMKTKDNVEQKAPGTPKQTNDVLNTDTTWPLVDNIQDSSMIMPKLQLSFLEFDTLNVKLDQVKIKRVDSFSKSPEKNNTILTQTNKVIKKTETTEEYISSFFNKPSIVYEENKPKNYARMKLINILEDIKVDKGEAQKFISNVNPDTLQQVESITVKTKNTNETCSSLKIKEKKPLESEEIEEIDSTASNTENLLIPPTQFLDITLEMEARNFQKEFQDETLLAASTSEERINLSGTLKSSQERIVKKPESFDFPNTFETNLGGQIEKPEVGQDIEANETFNSQLDVSATDEGFDKIKDMIMRKHNLELSPQFVYGKKNITALNFQKSDDIITSKFFQNIQKHAIGPEVKDNVKVSMEAKNISGSLQTVDNQSITHSQRGENPNNINDISSDRVFNSKRQKVNENPLDEPKSGFLFSREARSRREDISNSLNVSVVTTGMDEGDADFPHCLDTSLLLSPKADLSMSAVGEHQDVLSQDVPNFLSGLRKTGMSFFGFTSSDSKPELSAQNKEGSGFSFKFGSDEKKAKGTFFNMFQ